MHNFTGNSFDELYYKVLDQLLEKPDFICSPRGDEVRELLATTLVLRSPWSRVLNNQSRGSNHAFMVGEFLWYWSGSNDLERICYYNKRMKDFSDDGKTVNSAYGFRFRVPLTQYNEKGMPRLYPNQWDSVIQTLRKDVDSRRAVIVINSHADVSRAAYDGSKDVPCTQSLQFFIRDGKLHMHVSMRSNDVVWGLTNDLFSFTMLQECMLLELREFYPNLELGKYLHTAGSLHIYSWHYDLVRKIMEEYRDRSNMAVFYPRDLGRLTKLGDLDWLAADSERLRLGAVDRLDPNDYEGDILKWMVERLNEHKEKRNGSR